MILVKHHLNSLMAYEYFAVEEYLLNNVLQDDETYFFTWQIKGIVIGKNQVLQNEVNQAFTKANNINIFRRPTGGGAIYADENNLMFSIITKKIDANFSFKTHLTKIIDSLNLLGLNLEFSGRNDILLDGKKVSGNAFCQTKNGFIIHGTLMYDVDINTLVRSLNPDQEKLITKGIASIKSRVTNLSSVLDITLPQLINHLQTTLTNQTYILTNNEYETIKQLASKYADHDYIYTKQPPFNHLIKQRFGWGLFEMGLLVVNGIIKESKITGDYFEIKDINTYENLFINQPYDLSIIKQILKKHNLSQYILGSCSEDVILILDSLLEGD